MQRKRRFELMQRPHCTKDAATDVQSSLQEDCKRGMEARSVPVRSLRKSYLRGHAAYEMDVAGAGDPHALVCVSATKTGGIMRGLRHKTQADSSVVATLCREALRANDYGSTLNGRPSKCLQNVIIALAPGRPTEALEDFFSTYCANDAPTGGVQDAECKGNLVQAMAMLKRHNCSVRVIEIAALELWNSGALCTQSEFGARKGLSLGSLLCCCAESHVFVLTGVPAGRKYNIENVVPVRLRLFRTPVGGKHCSASGSNTAGESGVSKPGQKSRRTGRKRL